MYCGAVEENVIIDPIEAEKRRKLYEAEVIKSKRSKAEESRKQREKWKKWNITWEKGGSPIVL